MAEFKLTNTQWDPAQVTPKSLNSFLQMESAHMLMSYWERQIERIPSTDDGAKYKALDCPFRTFQEAHQSVKDKRRIVIRWMYEVCTQSKCELTVHAHAIKLFDRFLCTTNCSERNLQAVAGACILLASKFRETTPLSINRISSLTRGAAPVQMLQDIEIVILLKLHWDISSTTYIEILPFIYDILASNPSMDHKNNKLTSELKQEDFRSLLTATISDLAFNCYLHEPDILTKPASVVAVQCLTLLLSENNLCDVRIITRALHAYIPTMRNNEDMNMCWQVAREVWTNKNRANIQPRIVVHHQPVETPSSQNSRHLINSAAGDITLGCHVLIGSENTAMDSGTYSGD